jgi:hypothetical protein
MAEPFGDLGQRQAPRSHPVQERGEAAGAAGDGHAQMLPKVR